MYVIVVKYETRPEWTDKWLDLVDEFTQEVRKEPGNLWFEWSKSVENPHEWILIEGFTDEGAVPHVNSEHFKQALKDMPQALAHTPRIVSRQVDGEGWDQMGEITID